MSSDSRIFRYELRVTDVQKISLPSAHLVLSVAPGRGGYHIDMWAQVKPSHHAVERTFHIAGTGHPLPDLYELNFIGTAVMSDGLVWHVFVEPQ